MNEIPSILREIVERKREEVAYLKSRSSYEDISRIARDCSPSRDFYSAISKENRDSLNLIAEIKKSSPSKGDIRPNSDHVRIAQIYEEGNVDAISILTDEGFKGKIRYLREIRNTTKLPLLRKDFIIDEIQIPESKIYGADAILLISAILDENQLKEYREIAESFGLQALVESHNEEELEKAIKSKAKIYGINNRNLNNFVTNIQTTINLTGHVPKGYPIVTESGIRVYEDVKKLMLPNITAMLVGESIMSQKLNPTEQDMKRKIYELKRR